MSFGRNDPCPCGSGKKYKHCCESKQTRAVLPAAELNQLGMLLNAGRLADVEVRANGLLASYPNEGGLWKLLAIALQMQGKDGLPAFRRTAELLPNDAGAQMNLGNALQNTGQLEEAVLSYQRALVIKPTFAEAHSNLGSVFAALKQLDHAAASYRRAIQIKPDFAAAHNGLGGVLRDLGQLEGAAVSYRHAIKYQPNLTEAHNNLGVTLRDLGQFEEAIVCYRQALKLQSDDAAVLSNLGVALRDLGRLDEAVISLKQALSIQPHDAQTLSNLGLALHDLGKFDEAVISYRQAITISPDYAEAHNNLGLTLDALGKHSEAVISCRRATMLQPNFAEAHNNLGNTFTPLGQINNALLSYRQALSVKPDYFEAYSNVLMASNYTSQPPADYLAEALCFGKRVASKVTQRFTSWQVESQPQRLRVGVVSADLHNHPVGHFLESLLAQLNTAAIELIAYTNNPISDDLTARIKPHFSAWKPIFALNNQAAAQLIHDDGIHILIDLAGHTAKNRLPMFAWKPAPIQVSWLGYFASTGVTEMDYLLVDETGVPPRQHNHFSEAIWYLPDTRLCFTPPNTDLPITPLPSLSGEPLTFGCYQNLAKISDDILAVWGRILVSLPQSRLRLASKQLKDPTVAAQLQQRLQQHGIAESRVSMYGAVARQDYLASHAEVDLLLDTFPYPGGTTTCEALWMGVPTLTLAGNTLLSRQGASLLTAAGLSDWIAQDEDDYVAKAIHFARDLPKLAALRAGLREQVRVSPLFDAPRFARHFEEALWGMWQAKMGKANIFA